MHEKALGLLGISHKGGNIAIGEEPVGTAAREGRARLIILASDAAGHTARKAASFAAKHQSPTITIDADKATLGAMFGRTSVAMLALTDIFLAQRFLEMLEQERYAPQLQAVREKAAAMVKRQKEQRPVRGRKAKK